MTNKSTEASAEDIAAVEKALGEPYMPDLSDEALKVRRNLLVVSLISIAGTFANIRVATDSLIFGFHLQNLDSKVLGEGIACIVIYMLLHFLWYAVDGFVGWRVRVTGTRVLFITTATFADENMDYPSDPRQSTLHNWWRVKRGAIGNLHSRLPSIEASLADLHSRLEEMQAPPNIIENSSNVSLGLGEVQRSFIELKSAIDIVHKSDVSPRVVASLARFDNWYRFWLKSQNLRWIVIDVLLPILLGLLALGLLIFHR